MTTCFAAEESVLHQAASFLRACAQNTEPTELAEIMGYAPEAASMLLNGNLPIDSIEFSRLRQIRTACGETWDETTFISIANALRATEKTTAESWVSAELTYDIPASNVCASVPKKPITNNAPKDNELTLRQAAAGLLDSYRKGSRRRHSIISNAASAIDMSLPVPVLEAVENCDLEIPFDSVATCVRYLCVAEITGLPFNTKPQRAEKFRTSRRDIGQRFRRFGYEDITID